MKYAYLIFILGKLDEIKFYILDETIYITLNNTYIGSFYNTNYGMIVLQ